MQYGFLLIHNGHFVFDLNETKHREREREFNMVICLHISIKNDHSGSLKQVFYCAGNSKSIKRD